MFCSKCGQKNSDDARFCNACGAELSQEKNGEHTDAPKEDVTQRRMVYDGAVHKCPHCGEVLGAFVAICPSCGKEIRGAKASTIVIEFQSKLENAQNDQQRIAIISGFSIPNTKEDILEMMLVASSNLDVTIYVNKLHEEDITDAWMSLLSRCYAKAKSSFGDLPEFIEVKNIYDVVISKIEAVKAEIIKKNAEAQLLEEYKQKVARFSKNGGLAWLIICCIISVSLAIASFIFGKILTGVLSAATIALYVVAILIGKGILKIKNRYLIAVFAIIAILATLVSALTLFSEKKSFFGTIDLQELYLVQQFPECEKNKGAVKINKNETAQIEYSATEREYYNYLDQCIAFGYSIDIMKGDDYFEAYNNEGYCLTAQYSGFLSVMVITVEEPLKMGDIVWSNSDVGKQIPVPKSSIGKIEVESETEYSLFVGNVTSQMYEEYVDEAISVGCNVNYMRGDRTFFAEKRVWFTTFRVQIDYIGYNTIYIKIYKVT